MQRLTGLKARINKVNVKIQENTENSLEILENNPTKENYENAISLIENDLLISKEDRETILKEIDDRFLKLLENNNFDEMAIEDVEQEIFYLKNKGKQVVYMIGKRLNYLHEQFSLSDSIKYEKLKDYKTFENYIQSKFNIARQTGYQYMGIAKYYDVCAHRQIDYSKLVPFLSILKEIEKSERNDRVTLLEKMIAESIEIVENHSYREVKKIVIEKKNSLGFSVKEKDFNNGFSKSIDAFLKKIPDSLSEYNKVEIERLINKLKKMI
ncbi:MAG TPA: hypothetical protein PK771_00055 [Spirochaetota bacterium]|nr:hypothetical protein [Spirochaetota bacterium]